MNQQVINVSLQKASLKRKIRRHLWKIGFQKSGDGSLSISGDGKEAVRALHEHQRNARLEKNREFLINRAPRLFTYFASGIEIQPESVTPVLEKIDARTWQAELFRLASLTWSVPVSHGFGRRLRYLVWDNHNRKLIGLIAIGDPVFNLAARDNLIGWNAQDRSARLVNIMDAYVLGAVPPYNSLLAGKMVACLVRTQEIFKDFRRCCQVERRSATIRLWNQAIEVIVSRLKSSVVPSGSTTDSHSAFETSRICCPNEGSSSPTRQSASGV